MRARLNALHARLTGTGLGRRLFVTSGLSIVSSGAGQLIGLLTMIVSAHILGPTSFGRLVALQTTLATVGLLSGFGVGATVIRYLPTHRLESAERIGRILALCERVVLVLGITFTGVAAVFSDSLSHGLFNTPGLARPLAVALGGVTFLALDGLYKSSLIGLERIKPFALVSIGGQLWNFAAVTLGAATSGLWGAAVGLATSAGGQALISRLILTRHLADLDLRFVGRGSATEWRVLRDFALPSLLGAAMVGPAHWLCQLILTDTPGGFRQVAVLGIAVQWFNAIVLLPMAVGRVLTPVLVESTAKGDHDLSVRVLRIGVGSLALITIPFAAAIAALAGLIMHSYGNDFAGEAGALRIAALAGAIAAIASPIGNILIARSRTWLGLAMNFGWACVYVGLGYTWRGNGALGMMTSLTVAYVALTAWTMIWVRWFGGAVKPRDAAVARSHRASG